jgi:hypothetical protein
MRREFLAAKAACEVYALYGKSGVTDTVMLAPEHQIGKTAAYYVRRGGHDVTAYVWEQYLSFADRQLRRGTTK